MTDTEKSALCKRIDELCAEVERLHADQVHWELGNCPHCPNIVSLQEALEQNAKLRELADSSYTFAFNCYHGVFDQEAFFRLREKYRDSGIEVDK